MPTKPKPKPLWVTQAAIKKEQADMKKRAQLRIAQLFAESEDSKGQVNVATQTDVTLQSATAMQYRNVYLTVCCFCVLILCMNLLLLQWLYLYVIKH